MNAAHAISNVDLRAEDESYALIEHGASEVKKFH
jgi:hypothetical protein